MASRTPLRWTVVFGWRLRWNWSWFRDKLVKASTRPHTTSTYQGDLHAMPAKSLAFHKQQGRVGGQVPFCYLCAYIKRKYIYHAKCKPQPPTYQTDTFTQVIYLRHQVSELFTLIFCPYTLLPSLSWLPGMGTYVMNTRRDETRKAGMLTPRVRVQCPLDLHCSTGRRDLLLALQQRHRRVCAPNEGQWHDFMFQRSCQKLQWMRVNRQRSEDGREVNSEKVEQRGGNDNQEYVTGCNK